MVSMVEIVMAEVVASLERVEEIMTDGPIPQRIGPFRYQGTKESKLNCSVKEITSHLASILIAMRIFQWRPPEAIFQHQLKM